MLVLRWLNRACLGPRGALLVMRVRVRVRAALTLVGAGDAQPADCVLRGGQVRVTGEGYR